MKQQQGKFHRLVGLCSVFVLLLFLAAASSLSPAASTGTVGGTTMATVTPMPMVSVACALMGDAPEERLRMRLPEADDIIERSEGKPRLVPISSSASMVYYLAQCFCMDENG